ALLLLAVFLAGALAVERAPVGISCTEDTGIFGPVGSCVRFVIAGFIGLPAFALIVAALAVHGLRMLGRVEANTDRSWLLCLLGLAVVLPIAFGLAAGADREAGALSGTWGGMLAFYFARAFGMAGAWILVVLLLSAVTVATLRWTPLRAVMGARVLGSLGAAAARAKSMPAALALEPAPEEMPAMDPSLDPALDDAAPEPKRAKSRKRRREESADDEPEQMERVPASRASRAPATRAERLAAELDASAHGPDGEVGAVPSRD